MSRMPYKAKEMQLMITENDVNYILGVVELADSELIREGGVEGEYGIRSTQSNMLTSDNRHAAGWKRARFRIRRWFKADTGQTSLFYNLHRNSTVFDLSQRILEPPEELSGIRLTGCIIYSYHLVGGSAQDIVVEEAVGEAANWEKIRYYDEPVEFEEPVDSGAVKVEGEIWFNEVSAGGMKVGAISFATPLSGVDALGGPRGGAAFEDVASCPIAKGSNGVVNGDFETGDFTAWIRSHAGDFTIDGVEKQEGNWSARFNGTDLSGSGPYIRQNLAIDIPVDGCLDNNSDLSVQLKTDTVGATMSIVIAYTDFTSSTKNITATDTNWNLIDFLSEALVSGKTITAIEFSFVGDGKQWWIDDVRIIP